MDGDVAIGMVLHVLCDDGDEGVTPGAVQVVVVQDQRVGLEDLWAKAREKQVSVRNAAGTE